MYSRALIPLDGSEAAEAAVTEVIRMAPAVESVHLMVVENPILGARQLDGYTMYVDQIVQMRREAAMDYLRPLREKLDAAGLKVTAAVAFGDSVKSIARAAQELDVDLILLGGEEGGWFWRHTGMAEIAPRLARRVRAAVLVVQDGARKEKTALAGMVVGAGAA